MERIVFADSDMTLPLTETVASFLRRRAEVEGAEVSDLRARIEAHGVVDYFATLIMAGQITSSEAAEILGRPWFGFHLELMGHGAVRAPEAEAAPLHLGVLPEEHDGDLMPATLRHFRNDPDIAMAQITYPSTVSDLGGDLSAEVAYRRDVHNAPVLVVVHGGYPGSRFFMDIHRIARWADKGLFVIAPSKRGRDGSPGTPDAWGVEVQDVVDAVDHCLREFRDLVDPENINIWGLSGGGADVVGAVVRFPDLFRVAVCHEGPIDLELFRQENVNWDRLSLLGAAAVDRYRTTLFDPIEQHIGGTPSTIPDRYLARDVTRAAINVPRTRLHLVWDTDEISGLMGQMQRRFAEESARCGYTNVVLHVSGHGSPYRWHHWLTAENDFFDVHWLPDVLAGTVPPHTVPDGGTLVVPGYLRTKRFGFWLGDGAETAARVDYEIGPGRASFGVRPLGRAIAVPGRFTLRNVAPREPLTLLDGDPVKTEKVGEDLVVPFRLPCRIEVKGSGIRCPV